MIEEGSAGTGRAFETDETESAKEELQRRLVEARESIAQTVTEIKETVSDQYETVRETVAETLSWREQFRKHPLEWSLGSLAVGFAIGYSVADDIKDTAVYQRLQEEADRLGEILTDRLSGLGDLLAEQLSGVDEYVVPAMTGAALPLLLGQLKEFTGLDLTDILGGDGKAKKRSGKGKKKKKNGAKKKKRRDT